MCRWRCWMCSIWSWWPSAGDRVGLQGGQCALRPGDVIVRERRRDTGEKFTQRTVGVGIRGGQFFHLGQVLLGIVESPDLMADIRLVSALSKEFPLLPEELDVDDVEDAASSVKRLEVLCRLEISMNSDPFP